MNNGKGTGDKKRLPVLIIALIVVVVMMLITVLASFGFVWSKVSKIQKVDDDDTDPYYIPPGSDYLETDDPEDPFYSDTDDIFPEDSGMTDPGDTGSSSPDTAEPGSGTTSSGSDTKSPTPSVTTPKMDPVEPLKTGDLINIAIIGQDRREGQGRQRSDSMIIVSINPAKKKVSLISFLRDTYVSIPGGYKDNRLNVAYVYGGFKLFKSTMKQNFGITIDGCFECDFYDFMEIINILGGVEITVTEKEAEHMTNFLGTSTSPGTQTLDGAHALAYARIRKIDSDFSRTRRQRTIMLTLFNKFKNAGVGDLNNIANTILPKLATDMSDMQIISLMTKMLPLVSSVEIKSYSVPFDGAYRNANINGASVLVPDLKKIRNKLANEYLPY